MADSDDCYISPTMTWSLASTTSPTEEPTEWIPATVPGVVQVDWVAAWGWPPHIWAEEATRYRGLEDLWWHYRTELP